MADAGAQAVASRSTLPATRPDAPLRTGTIIFSTASCTPTHHLSSGSVCFFVICELRVGRYERVSGLSAALSTSPPP
jgi:hypothetical protein